MEGYLLELVRVLQSGDRPKAYLTGRVSARTMLMMGSIRSHALNQILQSSMEEQLSFGQTLTFDDILRSVLGEFCERHGIVATQTKKGGQ